MGTTMLLETGLFLVKRLQLVHRFALKTWTIAQILELCDYAMHSYGNPAIKEGNQFTIRLLWILVYPSLSDDGGQSRPGLRAPKMGLG